MALGEAVTVQLSSESTAGFMLILVGWVSITSVVSLPQE